jgi:beta-glucosidase
MRVASIKLSVILLLLCLCGVAQTNGSPAAVAERAETILRAMTLEEKLDYIGGTEGFYIRAIPRLGLPALKMADGPAGVRNYGPSAAYPTGIALAASFDVALVRRVGESIGRDARARGVHIMLGPGMNLYRAPMCGRNFEYLGEDPFLASRAAVSMIDGMQSQGISATAKHFVANDQEWDRNNVSSDVDERTLRELYLPAFEASVREAHVGAVMDSYNLVNGTHMTQNGYLNTEVLRREWGFQGILMTDWDATYDGVAAANNGLDLEMPNGKFMNRATLMEAIRKGSVAEKTIDEKVRHILETAIRFGFFDREQTDASIPLDNPQAHEVALEAARGSIVLLKNDGILPLELSRHKRIAVIGPNGDPAAYTGGGSGQVVPFHAVSPLEGIRALAGGKAEVVFRPGVQRLEAAFASTVFSTADGQPGLRGEFFNNVELKGEPALVRTDQHVYFDWNDQSYTPGGPRDDFSARWTGFFTAPRSQRYTFSVSGDDGYRLWVDDQLLIDQWVNQAATLRQAELELAAGRKYKIRLEYYQASGGAELSFAIAPPAGAGMVSAAVQAAANAELVILCVGFNARAEGEGSDRPFALPADQLGLMDAVLKANKNVIVVLNAGGNVEMASFLPAARALLHAWYPGQEGGTALAEILFGKVNPSGKLPISLESKWADAAAANSYYDHDGNKRVAYSEGIFLGYRHFDRSGSAPLFPFGFGLSYTTFAYSGLKVTPATVHGEPGYQVSYTIKNTGAREGAEVSQVYVSELHPVLARPVKELKGFARSALRPGESRKVVVELDRRAFSYYDVASHGWKITPGEFAILVGGSSAKIELKQTIAVAK